MGIDLSEATDMDFKPTLYQVHQVLDENIVGEHEARLALFTNWLLGHQNVMMSGQRASGKTFTVTNVSKLIPDENGLYNLSAGSEKSGWYQAEALKKHSHVMIPELNKLPKPVLEILKDWGEFRTSEYNVVLFEGGVRSIRKYKLPHRPFVFCLADEEELKVDDQLRSRLTIIRTDNSEEQNIAVNQEQAKLAMLPSNPKVISSKLKEELKQHVYTLPPFDDTLYKHPAAEVFVECIPPFFTDCRRDFPKYLANTYGITRFHWKDRMSYKEGDKTVFFVTPQDMYYNHVIYGQTLVESSMRCNFMERQMIDIVKGSSGAMDRTGIQNALRRKGMNISAQMISKHLNTLSNWGYLHCEKLKSTSPAAYSVGDFFKEFSFDVDWPKVFEECIKNIKEHYPEYADEYIKRYCDGEQLVIHPFSGVEQDVKLMKSEVKFDYDDKEDDSLQKFAKEEDETPDITPEDAVASTGIGAEPDDEYKPVEEEMVEDETPEEKAADRASDMKVGDY